MKAMMKTLCMVTGLISAIAATTIGLNVMFGYDFLGSLGADNLATAVKWIFGISGIISLALYIMHMLGVDCGCGE